MNLELGGGLLLDLCGVGGLVAMLLSDGGMVPALAIGYIVPLRFVAFLLFSSP